MAKNVEAQRANLKDLVNRAVASERRILSLAIVFTVVIVAGGFAWVVYSANRVTKLKTEETRLNASLEQTRVEIANQTEILRQTQNQIVEARSAVREGEPKKALAALSTAEKNVQIAINNPIKVESPSPTPTASPIVPDVKGLTFADAYQKVRSAGLPVKKVDQQGQGTPGTVLYQDPLPGVRVAGDTSICLYVIPTVQHTLVPNVTGLPFEAGDQRITDSGLVVKRVPQQGRGSPGTILYQDPLAGQRKPLGSEVKLYTIPNR